MVYPYKRKAREESRAGTYKRARTINYVRPSPAVRESAMAYANKSTRGFLGLEKKFVDSGIAATNISSTIAGSEIDPADADTLCAITQGDGPSSRDGRKIVLKSVHVKGTVDLPGADNINNGDTNVFIALVLDKQTNGAQLNAEDVFTQTTGLSSQPFRNLEYIQRFDVLASKTIVLNSGGIAYNGTTLIPLSTRATFEFYRTLDLPVMFSTGGTGGQVSTIVDNSLHMIAIADNTSAIPQIIYNSRVRWVG